MTLPKEFSEQRQSTILQRLRSTRRTEEALNVRKQVTISDIPLLNEFLKRYPLIETLAIDLEQNGVQLRAAFVIGFSLFTIVITIFIAMTYEIPLLLGLVIGAFFGFLPYVFIYFLNIIRMNRFEVVFPEMISLITNALKTGQGLQSSFNIVAQSGHSPVKEEFDLINQKLKLGVDFKNAMVEFAGRNKLSEVSFFTSAVLIQKESGGNLAEVLTVIEGIIRERFAIKREYSVLSAQGRMSGLVLMLIPVGLFIILSFLSDEYIPFYLQTNEGRVLAAVIITLYGIGMAWIQKIIHIRI
jgi:tight adherence protein B